MTYTISKHFHFSASHQLDGLPDGHKCARVHGHNYVVTLVLTGPLDDAGMVYDYGRLKPFADYVKHEVDHRHLNDLMPVNPTAEHLAVWFFDVAMRLLDLPEDVELQAVGVAETYNTYAEYSPS